MNSPVQINVPILIDDNLEEFVTYTLDVLDYIKTLVDTDQHPAPFAFDLWIVPENTLPLDGDDSDYGSDSNDAKNGDDDAAPGFNKQSSVRPFRAIDDILSDDEDVTYQKTAHNRAGKNGPLHRSVGDLLKKIEPKINENNEVENLRRRRYVCIVDRNKSKQLKLPKKKKVNDDSKNNDNDDIYFIIPESQYAKLPRESVAESFIQLTKSRILID
eukprot:CAMPEP_0114666432 /NCGR_PEP_ID=MMETSP0191-20121206/32511_1 /TAXON_ID=126664 /ORGANISM="Sorites sp." /LENGTH=214 /DNA_ID=CAMNT_0001913987 /DNA_START=634 /DNA_END=1275 /DNA_ORIENTATION=+